jgi:tRNA-dependent cyclodipeptide synthase
MASYMRWSADHFNELLVIVADHLEAYNVCVFKRLCLHDAFRRTAQKGRELRTGYLRAIPSGLEGRIRVVLASQLLEEEGCAALARRVRAAAMWNKAFSEELARSIRLGLDGKLREAEAQGIEIGPESIRLLSEYLIEEIAIILYITHAGATTYSVLLFPHFIPPVLDEIYAGKHRDEFADVTRGEPMRCVQVVRCEPAPFAGAAPAGAVATA